MYDPLKVKKTDHPDLVGGIVWADCELDWIRDYGKRCFNHGNAHGMEAGRLLFEEPKVGAGRTASVPRSGGPDCPAALRAAGTDGASARGMRSAT